MVYFTLFLVSYISHSSTVPFEKAWATNKCQAIVPYLLFNIRIIGRAFLNDIGCIDNTNSLFP